MNQIPTWTSVLLEYKHTPRSMCIMHSTEVNSSAAAQLLLNACHASIEVHVLSTGDEECKLSSHM